MADFPRTVMPIAISPLKYPSASRSVGQSGKIQTRGFQHNGRYWEERYPPLQLDDVLVRQWMAKVQDLVETGAKFDVEYMPYRVNNGNCTGSPRVNGAGQTGNNLTVMSAPAGVTDWLKAGDIIRCYNSSPISNLVFQAREDVDTDGGGGAIIPVTPTLYAGMSPGNNELVTVQNVKFHAFLPGALNGGLSGDSNEFYLYIVEGITLTFAESV